VILMEFDYNQLLKKAQEKIPKKIDTTDRFKVPEVVCELHGNKTLVKNFMEIINILRREPNHMSKYLFKELATPGNVEGTMLILQTKVPIDMLQKKIEDYIKEFINCKECGEPDTRLVKEGRIIYMVCEACGAKHPVRSL
jgi:translation initiation factor 2 subunit 2